MARKRTTGEGKKTASRKPSGSSAAERARRDQRQQIALLEARVEELSQQLDEARRLAAESAELRRELEQLDARLDHMSELGKELNALSFEQVRDACERHLPFIVSAHKMSLYVLDEERRRLELRASNHSNPIDESVDVSERSASLMRLAMETGLLTLIRDVDAFRSENGLAVPSGQAKNYETESCAIAPLASGGKIIGVLNLADKKDGTEFNEVDDRKFIQQVADLVAIALRNCLLLDKVRHVQSTDSLTQLMNRPAMINRIDLEARRARRYRARLALILADVNGFRLINGNHGHALGDRVLTEVARRLEQAVRDVDIVGRYGGDEFAILLPHQDARGARHVADRIGLLDVKIEVPGESEPLVAKLSVGVAELEKDMSPPQLLEKAETALAQAKGK